MSTKKVYEDKDKIVYEKKDDTPIIGSGSTEYRAVDKHSSAKATGKTVGEARSNLDSGKSKK